MRMNLNSSNSDRAGIPKHFSFGSQLKRTLHNYRWALITILGLSGLILGYIGFAEHAEIHGVTRSPWDLAYLVLQLISLESGSVTSPVPWPLAVARMLVPFVTGYAAILALAMLFSDQIQRITLRFARNHVVICGLGHMGSLLARECSRMGMRVAVIELDEHNPYIKLARQAGATVFIGDATNPDYLRSAGTHHAKYLVVLCGEDASNAEIVIVAKDLAGGRSEGVLTCILQIGDPTLSELLRSSTFTFEQTFGVRLEILNFYDIAARSILKSFPTLLNTSEVRATHIIILGCGYLGTSIILQAALAWRGLGQHEHNSLNITLIDLEAQKKVENLESRYAWLSQFCTLKAEDMDIFGPEFNQKPGLHNLMLSEEVTGICVCLDDNAKSLSAGLMLQNRLRGRQIPIILRMSDDKGLAKLIPARDHSDKERNGLYAFPLLENVCQLDLVFGGIHEILARAIHENYMRTQADLGETYATNPSLVSWEELPERLKHANREQSTHLGAKLRSIGCVIAPLTDIDAETFQFTPEEIEYMSEIEHNRWMEDLRREGYRYAPGSKDLGRKTHPSLVPWSDLAEDEKEKDRSTTRVIPKLLAMGGLQVYRAQVNKHESPLVPPIDKA